MARSWILVVVALMFAASLEAGPVRSAGKVVGKTIAKCGVVKVVARGTSAVARAAGKGAAAIGKKAFKVV